MSCKHRYIQLHPSPFAELAGYEQPSATTCKAAESSGRPPKPKTSSRPIDIFPGPLVLPHDDLNYNPDCPRQDPESWISLKQRNSLSIPTRENLYVVQAPIIKEDVELMKEWSIPHTHMDYEVASLDTSLFIDYLKTFYYGMNIKSFPEPLSWTSWEKPSRHQPSRRANLPKNIGLTHANQSTRIRVRTPPNRTFLAQVNLKHITDALIEMLPDDAYAMILVIDQDMYEGDDDDDFCCGRAFGESRVAVVQTARYIPCLDASEAVDRAHMWPMSHCKDFVDALCAVEDVEAIPTTTQQIVLSKRGPMRAAIDAASTHQ